MWFREIAVCCVCLQFDLIVVYGLCIACVWWFLVACLLFGYLGIGFKCDNCGCVRVVGYWLFVALWLGQLIVLF